MKTYRYLYYNLFRLWLRKKDESENARINAIITITFLSYVNIMNMPLILFAVNKYVIFDLPDININVKVWIVSLLFATGILNYVLLARKQRHTRIIDEFKLEDNHKRKKGIVLTVFYLIISLVIPLFILLSAK